MNYISFIRYETFGYYKNYQIIRLEVDLTKNGLDNVDNVIEAIYASINSIKSDPNLEKIVNNIKLIEQTKFKLYVFLYSHH